MAKKSRQEAAKPVEEEKVTTKSIRIAEDDARKIEEIAEALGQPIWRIHRNMIAGLLPSAWQEIQPKLKRVRQKKVELAEIQQSD